tara:strand:- start:4961 stop:5584 length:624 start_codon:yes stop_codon:yes gene_type:complete
MIFNSDYLTIKKSKKNNYTVNINMDSKNNKILWEKVLCKFLIKQPKKTGEITINAIKIEKLSITKLEYHIALKLINDISTQIFLLKNLGYGITHFDIDDIIIIDDDFLFINPGKIVKEQSKKLYIDKIIKKNKFISPELDNLESIPNKIHYKTSIYSLALICIYCLTKKNIKDNPLGLIDYIYGTKLYWCIERCLEENPKNRFLYII